MDTALTRFRPRTRHGALRAIVAAGAAGALIASLAACGTDGETNTDTGAGSAQTTLTIGQRQPVTNMDPHTTNPPSYAFPAYATPIFLAPDGTLVADLATDWGYTDDQNTVFEFTLRDGVVFSDGDELTADGVVDSLERFLSLENNSNLASAGPVEAIAAVDDDTVRITYTEPFPNAAVSLTQDWNFGFIISPTGLADPSILATETHGAGQYVLDASQTVTDSVYTFTKNENYWNPEAQKFETVVLKPIPDDAAQLAALQSGEIDYANNVSSLNVQSAKDSGFTYSSSAGIVWFLMLQERDSAPLQDVRVREAISLAIDRESIVSAIFSGLGQAQSSIVSAGQTGSYQSTVDAQDIARAKELLADAGYADGFTISALDTDALDANSAFASALAAQLAEIGITLELNVVSGSFDTFLGSLFGRENDTTAFPLQNIDLYYQYMLNLGPGALANVAGTTDDTITAAIQAAAVSSEADRDAAYTEMAKAYDEAFWNIPVALSSTNHLYVSTMKNFAESSVQSTPNGFGPDADLSWEISG